ncbi:MAG: hypothetical protein HYY30_08575 [Chloroflexi bacterium]|nr:hypothetical protein [Chloroflexota bacterium]
MLDKAAGLIAVAKRIVVFSGAGISTESGIPDFRSPGGVWEKYTPVQHQDFIASEEARREYWRMHSEIYAVVVEAKPNAAHLAIVELDAGTKAEQVQGVAILVLIFGLRFPRFALASRAIWISCQCLVRNQWN